MNNGLILIGGLDNLPLAKGSKIRVNYVKQMQNNWYSMPKIDSSNNNELKNTFIKI